MGIVMFFIATEKDIKRGKITDIYFERTLKILKKKGLNKAVSAEVRTKGLSAGWEWGIFAGLEECLELLKGLPINVRAVAEGTIFKPFEPVLEITGPYSSFCALETSLLGLLCQASGIATRAGRMRILAGNRTLLSFGSRRMHPAITPMIDRSAYIGGFDGVSVVKSAEMLGIEPSGTMPHSLVLLCGDTVKASEAFDEAVGKKVPRTVLIDTFQDEKFEALRVAEAMGKKLSAVRLDTPGSRRGDFLQILKEVRWELDLRGFTWVKLFVSGGITEDDIPVLNEVVDGYGIGTSLSNSPVIDFALDIVEIEGKPIAKRGKESGRKNLLECIRCNQRKVVPIGMNQARCRCGKKMSNLLTTAIKGGSIILKKRTPQEIRAMVLKGLIKQGGDNESNA